MTMMDWLRKLGILRYGAKTGTYTSGKDRPAEFLMDDVYNAEKDLTTKADLKAMLSGPPPVPPSLPAVPTVPCAKCGAALQPGGKFCAACGAPAERPPEPVCATCKAPLKEGARFCSSCGSPVAAGNAVPLSQAPSVPSASVPQGNRLPLVLLLAGGIGFLILVIIVVAVTSGKSQPRSPGAEVEQVLNRGAAAAGEAIRDLERETEKVVARETKDSTPAPKVEEPPARPVEPPRIEKPAAAGSGPMKYDLYRNPKFGFATELPAHWESSVKDNTHLFCGAQETEQHQTTINFQFIHKGNQTIRNQADEIIGQWKAMDDFDLDEVKQGEIAGHDMLYMVARFRTPSGAFFRQKQVIIERDPYYYMIAYTAPGDLYPKYEFVMTHLLETFRFLP